MIDTDKYKGHAKEGWHFDSAHVLRDGHDKEITELVGEDWLDDKATQALIADAPLLLAEVKRLREKNRIQRKILDAYSQYRDARYEDCETWMLEKGFRVMVQYGDEEQSEWKVEVE